MRVALRLTWVLLISAACSPKSTPPSDLTPPTPSELVAVADAAIATAPIIDAPPPQIDRDGDDDVEDPGSGTAPLAGAFVKVGAPPLALDRICDLTPLGNSLYMAHARQALGTDGATITRYTPDDTPRLFRVAFDWNRFGERRRGGGAGQGFLRVHAIDGRLFVADADPPYNGLGIVERGTEGYVFVSEPGGSFAPPRMPGHRPPKAAGVVPRAYHVLDVVKYRGALFASTGSVPPGQRAWRGASPGALHRATADLTRWIYEIDYPNPYLEGVWRLTYLVRFRDRLYAGIQDYDGREPNDFLIIDPEPGATKLEQRHVRPVRITSNGGAQTLRWWVDTRATPPRLYWISWSRADGVTLRVTTDGEAWSTIALPFSPSDITRFRDAVVVLTERALFRLDPAGNNVMATIATIAAPSPFVVDDIFCAAPLAVFRDELYAGGQRRGTLYKLRHSP